MNDEPEPNVLHMLAEIAARMRVSEPPGHVALLQIEQRLGLGAQLFFDVSVVSPSGQGCGARNENLAAAIRSVWLMYVRRYSASDPRLLAPIPNHVTGST